MIRPSPHPLFDTLPLASGGVLVLSEQPASMGAPVPVLQAYRQAGAGMVVSLLPEPELQRLGLGQIASDCATQALQWAHCPIEDFAAPGDEFEAAWQRFGPTVHALLDQGQGVALHCRAGLGRTGTVAARILLERGVPLQQAIETVRRTRPGSIETSVQENYLRRLALQATRPGSSAAPQ